MNETNPLSELRKTLKSLKDDGETVVPIDALLPYLDSPTPIHLETWKEECHRQRLEYQATIQLHIEMFRSVMASAHITLKSAILINGGAAVAVLAFVGSLVQHEKSVHMFGWVLGSFAIGVLLSAVASGGTYLAQRYYAKDITRTANPWTCATIVVIVVSYGLFLVGCVLASIIISQMG